MPSLNDIDFDYINAEFIITNGCNLKCDYCFERERIKDDCKIEFLSFEQVCNYMDLIIQNRKKKKMPIQAPSWINFFGGEPLLNIEIIRQIINKYNKYPFFHYSIITNGTLVTKEILKEFQGIPILWQFSIDSSNQKGNLLRFHQKSEEYTAYILQMIKETKEFGYESPIVSTVVNKDSVNYLFETYMYFYNNNCPIKWQIMLERIGDKESFLEKYQEQCLKILEKVVETDFNIPMLWKNVIEYITSLKNHQNFYFPVALGEGPSPNNIYIVGQNGKLYLTTNDLNTFDSSPYYSNIGDEKGIDLEKIKNHPHLLSLSVNEECKKCLSYLLNPCCISKKFMVYPSFFQGNCWTFISSTFYALEYLKRKGET